MRRRLAADLPDFPWDTIAEAKATASAHPGGIVDLSVGTPVDPTPDLGRDALNGAADSPGYPLTSGTAALRDAVAAYLRRRWQVHVSAEATLPSIGSKELVAWLPILLGFGAGDVVVVPATAYPTYAVGAITAGARVCTADTVDELDAVAASLGPDEQIGLLWLNSPSNPTGQILAPDELVARVRWARDRDILVASDECYGEFGWDADPVSVLHADISGGDHTGLLALHSLSKRSNLAGYRSGFVAGDPALVDELLAVRKHLGMIMPAPVQAATVALLADQHHVDGQRDRYLRRRTRMRAALESAGFRIDHSEGSLYLWSTRQENCRTTVAALADLGILVAPGDFYGEAGAQHVRVALTATDERIDAAADRLMSIPDRNG